MKIAYRAAVEINYFAVEVEIPVEGIAAERA